MAWIQTRHHPTRTVHAVRFRIDGRQSTVTWATLAEAEKFKASVDAVGPRRALAALGISDTVKVAALGRETVGE
jgi:hypothetical protein